MGLFALLRYLPHLKLKKLGPKYHMWYLWTLLLTQPGYGFILIVIWHFKIGFSQSQLTLFVATLKNKTSNLKLKKIVYCLLLQAQVPVLAQIDEYTLF